jgi:branched-chain amino acid transport system substrate-binding protein
MRRLGTVVALVLAPVAVGGAGASPGVTGSSILIGGIAPLSGEGSGVAKGAAAYFRYVNARGGANGRVIEYRVSESAQQLVEQDKAFVLFGTVGAEASRAIDGLGVPQLFVASGAVRLGPWTIGFPPTHALEGAVLARQVLKTGAKGPIAVLYEADADGRALLAAFQRRLGPRAGQLVATTEVGELRAGRAATFVVLGRAAASAGLPVGAVSVAYLKDPRDPRWAGDPALERYRRTGGLKNTEYEAGMAAAFTLVDTLRRAGKTPTRASVLAAARSMNEANNPFLVPGIVIKTSPTDASPIQQVALQRWSGGHWNIFTGPLTIAS